MFLGGVYSISCENGVGLITVNRGQAACIYSLSLCAIQRGLTVIPGAVSVLLIHIIMLARALPHNEIVTEMSQMKSRSLSTSEHEAFDIHRTVENYSPLLAGIASREIFLTRSAQEMR